jgi:hypothetical protein
VFVGGPASVHGAVVIEEKLAFAKTISGLLFYTESVIRLLTKDVFFTQWSFVHNSANVSTQGVHVTYFRSCPVLDNKIQTR